MIKPFSFAVVILAGGKSLRMNGVNKAFLDINNQKLINIILCKVENLKLPVAINANQHIIDLINSIIMSFKIKIILVLVHCQVFILQ